MNGVKEATDALVELGLHSGPGGHDLLSRRTSRTVATRALNAARPAWEAPIRAIHDAARSKVGGREVCCECMHDWPCPTIKALDGPKEERPALGYAGWLAAMAKARKGRS